LLLVHVVSFWKLPGGEGAEPRKFYLSGLAIFSPLVFKFPDF